MERATEAVLLGAVIRGALATGARTTEQIAAAVLAAGFRWAGPPERIEEAQS